MTRDLPGLFTNSYDFIDYMMGNIWSWAFIVIGVSEVESFCLISIQAFEKLGNSRQKQFKCMQSLTVS